MRHLRKASNTEDRDQNKTKSDLEEAKTIKQEETLKRAMHYYYIPRIIMKNIAKMKQKQ